MQGVARSMGGIVKSLDRALATNNIEKIAETMDAFERQFENLDVQSQVMEGAMSAQASLATPEEDVSTLLQQVADEHGLEVQLNLPQAGAQVGFESFWGPPFFSSFVSFPSVFFGFRPEPPLSFKKIKNSGRRPAAGSPAERRAGPLREARAAPWGRSQVERGGSAPPSSFWL